MDLLETLLYQDRNQLLQLIKTYDSSCNRNSKREIVEQLYSKLLVIDDIQVYFDGLSNQARSLIMQCSFSRKTVFSKVELTASIRKRDPNYLQGVINELITIGWLYPRADESLVMPFQVKEQVKSVCLSPIKENELIIASNASEQGGIIHFCDDLLLFIDEISERPLPLTKNGILYKRDFQMLMNKFQVQEELPNEQWRFGYGRVFPYYPNRFSLLYEYCYMKQWIKETNNRLRVTGKIKELDTMTQTTLHNDIIRFWLKLYKRPIPQIPFLYSFIKECITPGKAVSEQILSETLLPCVEEYYFDSKEDVLKKRFLDMLSYLEIISIENVFNESYYTAGKAYSLLKDSIL